MLRVGLTGGVGSGKSTVARLLAAHGAVVVDADRLARDVVRAGTDGFAAVVATFGSGVVGADGELDRAALAAIVFADAGARARLEAIVHPRVRSAAHAAELAAAAADPAVVVVHEIPLLVETGQQDGFDVVVVVDAEPAQQQARLTRGRGLTAAQVRARMAAQADRQARRAAADVVVDNTGSPEQLRARVAALWADLAGRAGTTRPR